MLATTRHRVYIVTALCDREKERLGSQRTFFDIPTRDSGETKLPLHNMRDRPLELMPSLEIKANDSSHLQYFHLFLFFEILQHIPTIY